MKIAIISDIHGNYESLLAVYNDIKKQACDKIYCLGDLIDYGPRPQEVIEFIQEHKIPTILGNHDAALFDKEVLRWFNDNAIESSQFSRKTISKEAKDFLKKLPLTIKKKDFFLVHAFPPDSFETYIDEATNEELTEAFTSIENLCFVGHTHILGIYEQTTNGKIRKKPLLRKHKLNPKSKYIVNVGSVGQPRDEDSRASYIIYDGTTIKVRRVTYNIEQVQELIREVGLAEENAKMLTNQ